MVIIKSTHLIPLEPLPPPQPNPQIWLFNISLLPVVVEAVGLLKLVPVVLAAIELQLAMQLRLQD